MRLSLFGLLAAVCCGIALAATPDGFYTSWADVQQAAKAANKPIYLHFTTTWCHWCRKIEEETYTNPKAKAALADYACASLDCTVPQGGAPSEAAKTNLGLEKKFGGSGYPFLVMLTPEGDLLHTIGGYVPADVFVSELATGKANLKEFRDFQAYAASADQTTLDFQARAMRLYLKLGQTDNSAKAAAKVLELDPKNEKGLALQANLVLLKNVPDDGWPDKALPYIAQIKKLDPTNAQGTMQEAMTMEGNFYLYRAQAGRDEKARNADYQRFIDIYTELITNAKKLNDTQMVYAMLGYVHLQLKHRDQAIANLQKSLDINPKSQLAREIQNLLAQAKQLK